MPVLVNFKICDNAQECGGIAICPTKSLSWDEENETIKIDNEKCISCGLCEKECPIGAIRVAKTESEYQSITEEITNDPRTTKDLFVDRYGAAPISEFFMINSDEIPVKTSKQGLCFIEIYNPDEIACLLKSIPIATLTASMPSNTLYYNTEVNDNLLKTYHINKTPCLLIFQDGKHIGQIEGYYEETEKDIVIKKINNIIGQ